MRLFKSALVEMMPVLDEATFMGRRAGSLATISTSTTGSISLPNGNAKPSVASLVNLLDLSSDNAPVPSSSGGDFLQDLLSVDLSPAPKQSGINQAPSNGTDVLLDLLSIGTPPAQSDLSTLDILSPIQDNKKLVAPLNGLFSPTSNSAKATFAGAAPVIDLLDGFVAIPPKPESSGSAFPSVVAFDSNSLKMEFNFSKPPRNPQTKLIQAMFTNLSSNNFTNFIF